MLRFPHHRLTQFIEGLYPVEIENGRPDKRRKLNHGQNNKDDVNEGETVLELRDNSETTDDRVQRMFDSVDGSQISYH